MDYNCIRVHLQHHLQHKSPHFRISSLVLLLIVMPTLAADDFTRIDPLGKFEKFVICANIAWRHFSYDCNLYIEEFWLQNLGQGMRIFWKFKKSTRHSTMGILCFKKHCIRFMDVVELYECKKRRGKLEKWRFPDGTANSCCRLSQSVCHHPMNKNDT